MRIPFYKWSIYEVDKSHINRAVDPFKLCWYKFGGKLPTLHATSYQIGIDCSAWVRGAISKWLGVVYPDGSWHQQNRAKLDNLKPSDYQAGFLDDQYIRMFYLPPTKTRPGHIGFIQGGYTIECSSSLKKVGRVKWGSQSYHKLCTVFVFARLT